MKIKREPKQALERSKMRHIVTVWGFLLLAVISGFVTLNAYVANSKEARKRYETLLAVDKAGGDVEKSLFQLRSYIYSHMNTTIGSPTGVKPPIQLKGTYDRLVAAEKARVTTAKANNAGLYTTAQQVCEKLIPDGLSGRGRIPCITDYVTKHSQSETEQTIPDGLYKYDFAAPLWSPGLAGYGIITTTVLLVIFLFRYYSYSRARHHLKIST